jgi:hypothetical protein
MSIQPAVATARPGSTWAPLYRAGAVSAIAMVVLMLVQMPLFFRFPPPSFSPNHQAALDWFALFDTHRWIALLHLDVFLLVHYVFVLMLFLALWVALRRVRPVTTLVAVVFVAVSGAVYFTSNPAFTMMSLADQYAVANSDAARSELLAAAQSALAVYHGTPFDVAYVLSAIAGLLMCSAMLRTGIFDRKSAYIGLVMYGMNVIPASAGTLGLVLSVLSLIPLAVWLVLVARRLWTLR